jgi:ubiquinone/menaquinone biosynthesis C-methylase UbiE
VSDPQGLAFDSAAEDYERGRTGWPPEIMDGVDGDAVLDLAAGTGKLTRLLVERYRRVVAIEPADAMRALGERLVPEAEWLPGSAEQLPLQEAVVDAAFVAEAFHWFDASAASEELARVLRPGGTLVACFNNWDAPYDPTLPNEAHAAIEEVAVRTGPAGRPKVEAGAWREGLAAAPFTPPDYREIAHVDLTDRDGVIAYYLSISSIAARPQQERDALRAKLERLVPDAEYTLRLRAEVWTARRR